MDVTLPNGAVIKGVPEGTPKDVIAQKAINSGLATAQDFGFQSQASEFQEPQQLPELQDSGLLVGQDPVKAAVVTPALLTATDPNEIAQIITTNFPDVGVTYQRDSQGAVSPVLVNNKTGAATSINQPGISGLDVMQTLGLMAAYTPAGRATTALGAGAKAAATGGVIESIQSATGGEFDPETLAIDFLGGAAGQKIFDLLSKRFGRPLTDNEIQQAKDFASKGFKSTRYAGRKPTPEEQADDIAKALLGEDQMQLAAQVDVSPELLAARETLDLKEPGLPSALSKNLAYREREQALKSIPESPLKRQEYNAITELQQKADDLITQYGGTTEKATLSESLINETQDTIKNLSAKASSAYDDIRSQVSPQERVNFSLVRNYINNELENLAGNADLLSPLEKQLLKMSEGDVTYHAADKMRKRIGATLNKESDVYASETEATLKQLYGLLTEEQEQVAKPIVGDGWEAAKELVKQRKALEDASINMFGKNLSEAFMPKIGQAMQQLSKGQYKKFDELIASVPKERRSEVVTSALNDVFTMGSRKEKQLSLPGFSDWYNSIKSEPALKNRIYKYLDPELRKSLDALGDVANGIRKARESEITTGRLMASPTVISGLTDAIGENFLSKLPGFIGKTVAGTMKEAKSAPEKAAMELLSDPLFIKNIKALAAGQAKKAQEYERQLMRKREFREFAGSLSQEQLRALTLSGLNQWLTEEKQ